MGFIIIGLVITGIGLLQSLAPGLFASALKYRTSGRVDGERTVSLIRGAGIMEIILGNALLAYGLSVSQ